MNVPHSGALVFFGATGDFIYKKISPLSMRWNGGDIFRYPSSGSRGWTGRLSSFGRGARKIIERHEGFDEGVFAKLRERLHYINGDYGAPAKQQAQLNPDLTLHHERMAKDALREKGFGWETSIPNRVIGSKLGV